MYMTFVATSLSVTKLMSAIINLSVPVISFPFTNMLAFLEADEQLVRRTRQSKRAIAKFGNTEIDVNLIKPKTKRVVTFGNFLEEHRIQRITIKSG